MGNKSPNAPKPPDVPPREAFFAKNTVDPSKLKNRKNRAVMLHALANIEQWAYVTLIFLYRLDTDLFAASI